MPSTIDSGDFEIILVRTVTLNSSSVISISAVSKTINSSMFIKKVVTVPDISSVAHLKKPESEDITSLANIKQSITAPTLNSGSYIKTTSAEIDIDSDAEIKTIPEANLDSDSNIKKIGVESTITSDARIFVFGVKTLDSSANILKSISYSLDSDAIVIKVLTKTLDSDAFIVLEGAKYIFISSLAYIHSSYSQDISSTAHILETKSVTLDSDAIITFPSSESIDSDAWINFEVPQIIDSIDYVKATTRTEHTSIEDSGEEYVSFSSFTFTPNLSCTMYSVWLKCRGGEAGDSTIKLTCESTDSDVVNIGKDSDSFVWKKFTFTSNIPLLAGNTYTMNISSVTGSFKVLSLVNDLSNWSVRF
jgi:hypothetical protein